jgi:hypothetical protein
MLAARGIAVSHETVRQWALKFDQALANQIRRRLPQACNRAMRPALPYGRAALGVRFLNRPCGDPYERSKDGNHRDNGLHSFINQYPMVFPIK